MAAELELTESMLRNWVRLALASGECPRLRAPGVPAALRLDAASGACDRVPSASRTVHTRRFVCVWQTAVQARTSDFGRYDNRLDRGAS